MPYFVIVNRQAPGYRGSPEVMAVWSAWFEGLGDHLVDRGNPVFSRITLGAVGAQTDLGGYTVVRAHDLDAATALARSCSALADGGGVEIGELTLLNGDPTGS